MRSILNALQEGRLFELPEAGKDRALEFLARILDANPDAEVGTDAIEQIKKREEACNTGIGLGVGVPHVRAVREEGDLFCAIGWSASGIDYGASDQRPVHLVFMYYIPGAQKNVYLKEISSLVKAIKKSGGIEPMMRASDLNAVRNLLLDWVSAVLSDTGPEAVARMIKLEVKQAQAALPAPSVPSVIQSAVPSASVPPATAARPAMAMAFSILVAPPSTAFVLAADAEWVAALERDPDLIAKLTAGRPFQMGTRQVFLTGATQHAAGRTLYQGVAITN